MGLFSDLLNGLIAVIGLVIGTIFGDYVIGAISFTYTSIILAIIGLIIAGFGLKRKSIIGAFVAGFGLGLATPITALIFRLL